MLCRAPFHGIGTNLEERLSYNGELPELNSDIGSSSLHWLVLWSYIVLTPRLKGIEVISATGPSIHACQCSQPGTINPPGVIVYSCQIGLLYAIDPQRQTSVICTRPGRSTPVHLDKVSGIADGKPTGDDKG